MMILVMFYLCICFLSSQAKIIFQWPNKWQNPCHYIQLGTWQQIATDISVNISQIDKRMGLESKTDMNGEGGKGKI